MIPPMKRKPTSPGSVRIMTGRRLIRDSSERRSKMAMYIIVTPR
jgi:hypothetical protein